MLQYRKVEDSKYDKKDEKNDKNEEKNEIFIWVFRMRKKRSRWGLDWLWIRMHMRIRLGCQICRFLLNRVGERVRCIYKVNITMVKTLLSMNFIDFVKDFLPLKAKIMVHRRVILHLHYYSEGGKWEMWLSMNFYINFLFALNLFGKDTFNFCLSSHLFILDSF